MADAMKIEIRELPVDSVKESEFNPRVKLAKGSKEYEKIRRSLEEFGFVEPIVVNDFNMTVLGGHQRLQVVKDSGAETIPAVIVHIESASKEKKLCVAMNKIKGEWDMEKLTDLLLDDGVSEYFTGFDEGEIDLSGYLNDEEDSSLEDMLEEDTEDDAAEEEEEPAAASKEVMTRIIISNNYKFNVPASKYYGLIDTLRDSGKFERADIVAELKRRLMQRD